jgi:uncharacterized repeat protein (TIGR03803 family)
MRAFGLVSSFIAAALLVGCSSGNSANSGGGASGPPRFTLLAPFTSTSMMPMGNMALVEGADGNFYGTTPSGGNNQTDDGFYGDGSVFKVTPSGTLTTIYKFCAKSGCPDVANPQTGLILASNGNFYGVTPATNYFTNSLSSGTVFEITAQGDLTTLYSSFCPQSSSCPDGDSPAALIQGADGNFYGVTTGGVNTSAVCNSRGCGSLFRITPGGTLTTLYSFCAQANCADGGVPSGLIQGSDGNFYGTTQFGGAVNPYYPTFGSGTVFKITPTGAITTLYQFCAQGQDCPDGQDPRTGVIQGSDGNFYGTTSYTIFKLTPQGNLTTLYACTQSSCSVGAFAAGLIQAEDGNFYGTSQSGGNANCPGGSPDDPEPEYVTCGTVYRMTSSGTVTVLYSFCAQANCADGIYPNALVQGSDGLLYGTTSAGGLTGFDGLNDPGVIFSLSTGLKE